MNANTRAFVNRIRAFQIPTKLDNATLHRRCHEMGDLAVAAVRAKLLGEPPHQSPSPSTAFP